MIIVLEGADNSGKSTLAKMLSEALNLEVVHPGGPPKNIADVINRCNEQAVTMGMSDSVDFIYDRITCISDMIYRNNQKYSSMFDIFHRQLQSCPNVLIVYCRPSDERLLNFDDHITQDHENAEIVQYAKDNAERIIYQYDQLADEMSNNRYLHFITYDFEKSNLETFDTLVKLIGERLDCL